VMKYSDMLTPTTVASVARKSSAAVTPSLMKALPSLTLCGELKLEQTKNENSSR
jgi:hypothetical protein